MMRGGCYVSVLQNWQQWTQFLGMQVEDAKDSGMSQKVIEKSAMQIGDYLANNVDPKNEQERVLKDLWTVAENNEKQVLASLVVKLVQSKPLQ
jgi:hypothetical protein